MATTEPMIDRTASSSTSEYPRSQWWAVALATEVTRDPAERLVLGTPLVLFRREDGTPVALDNRCVHRSFPLSRGRVEGDTIICGYHGFTFDCAGTCVRVPSQSHVPSRARVDAYPCQESDHLVWVWTGDPAEAGSHDLPSDGFLDDDMEAVTFSLAIDGNWRHLHDNLLDLTHFSYLHSGNVGSAQFAEVPADVEVTDGCVIVVRRMVEDPPPLMFERALCLNGAPMERESWMQWRSPALLCARVTAGAANDVPARRVQFRILHCITPSDEHELLYHVVFARDFGHGDQSISDAIAEQGHLAFAEDAAAVTWIDQTMRRYPRTDTAEISVKADAGALHARRLLDTAIAEDPARPR